MDGDSWGLLWRQDHFIEGNYTDRSLHCTAWSEYEKEAMGEKFKTGRAFAFFTIITLILSVSPVFALSCATIDANSLRLLAFCFLLATLFQGLVFVAFASDICQYEFQCRISFGGGLTVAGMVFCVLTAYSLLRVKQVSDMSPAERRASPVESDKQGTKNPDDSSTHPIDEEDARESNDERQAPMEVIGEEGAEEEEEEPRAGTSDIPAEVEAGSRKSEDAPAKGKRWWPWN